MNAPDRKLRQPAALARAIRAAIVVPALFALGVAALKEPAVIGFSVFGTFAHLVMVRYDGVGRKRSMRAAMLTVLGSRSAHYRRLARRAYPQCVRKRLESEQ